MGRRLVSRTRRLAALALLTAASLCVYLLEAQLPPLAPIPGIKLGLSNIFTLFTYIYLDPPAALTLLLMRILLGCTLTGQVSAIAYSLSGGLLAFAVLALLRQCFAPGQLWILSVFSAMAHQVGQLAAAALILQSRAVFWYLPAMLLAAMAAGALTGLAAQLVLQRLKACRNASWKKERKVDGR